MVYATPTWPFGNVVVEIEMACVCAGVSADTAEPDDELPPQPARINETEKSSTMPNDQRAVCDAFLYSDTMAPGGHKWRYCI